MARGRTVKGTPEFIDGDLRNPDVWTGTDAAEKYRGHGGKDVIDGGGGNDWLSGGEQGDTITGGPGADVFDYLHVNGSTPRDPDTITDFAHGIDKIDLTIMTTNRRPDPIHLVFVGDGDFLTDQSSVRFVDGQLLVNLAHTDSRPEMVINLLGVSEISASDLILA